MGFKMKSSPYGEKRSGEMDMKPRMSSNFDKSGMKNADGSSMKPGAPGLLGKILDPLGIGKKAKKLFGIGGKKGGTPPVDPNAAAAAATTGAAVAPPADEQAGPVAPPAGVAPTDPTLGAAPLDPNATPMPMRKNKKY
tara:strand:+ start:1000 stop:1413 length:414 start_codon:yes stop_codon:yes gene_type:complete